MSNNNIIMKKTTDANSFFIRFHHKSQLSDSVLTDTPEYKGVEIKIIQIMKIDDGYLLAECTYINN
jgi:hypothetical protein